MLGSYYMRAGPIDPNAAIGELPPMKGPAMRRQLLVLIAILGLGASAFAQDRTVERRAKGRPGASIRIGVFVNVKPDCTSGPSEDHQKLFRAGAWMDPDLNKFDLHHITCAHPRMSKEEWAYAYQECWQRYYSFEHCERVMRRAAALAGFCSEVQRVYENCIWTSLPSSLRIAWNGVLKPRHFLGVRLAVMTMSWISSSDI